MADVQLPSFADTKLQLLIGQWQAAPNLTNFLHLLLDHFDEQATDALNELHRMLAISTARGVWLDRLGSRVNLTRPTVLASEYTATFGFDEAGSGFNQARMRDVAALEPLLPIDDDLYRKMIRSRIVTIFSTPDIRALRLAVDYYDTTATMRDNLDMTVSIRSARFRELQLAEQHHSLPKPAGVQFDMAASDPFGFDEAGSGFNQGAIR